MDGFSKFHFKDLGDGESIIRVVHRNWFYILQQFVGIILALLVYFGAILFLPTLFPDLFYGQYRSAIYFFENFFLLALWIFGFMIWIDYYFDVWIITSERIVNIEQQGLFSRKSSELRFSKIQDVTTEVDGFLGTVLNYGDVKIQTAGTDEEFLFRTISDPYKVKDIIMELQKNADHDKEQEFGEMIKEKIDGQDQL
jgi:uncharacterized membrane protein YdbT with pleckstrin-like domain